MRIEGAKQLELKLKQLPKAVAKRVVRAAVSRASTPLMKAIRAAAPTDTKTLRKAVTRKLKTRKNNTVAVVGTKYMAAPHDHLVEDGTVNMDAQPFVEPTFEAMQTGLLRGVQGEIAKGIEQEAKK
jgi:HK97 gp10 family phage protein